MPAELCSTSYGRHPSLSYVQGVPLDGERMVDCSGWLLADAWVPAQPCSTSYVKYLTLVCAQGILLGDEVGLNGSGRILLFDVVLVFRS